MRPVDFSSLVLISLFEKRTIMHSLLSGPTSMTSMKQRITQVPNRPKIPRISALGIALIMVALTSVACTGATVNNGNEPYADNGTTTNATYTMSLTTEETPTPDNSASFNLQTASDRTDPHTTAVEFLTRYFESANSGGLLLYDHNSDLFEPTQSIVTAMKYLDWITLINYFLNYDIALDMGYYSSMQDANITNEGDITIVKGYCRTTAFGTFFEIQMQKNEAGNYVITGLDFPDSKEYVNFVEAFKKSTGELDAQASSFIDEQYNRMLEKCISDKKMTDEQIAVAVAKWHVKIHAVWNVAYDVENPSTCYLTDSSGLVIFNLSRSYTIATDSPMWLVSFNTDARPVFPTYCIDAKTFECIGYIPGA